MTAFTHTLQLPWTYELDNDGIAWVALSQEVQNSRAGAPANASLSSLIIGGEIPAKLVFFASHPERYSQTPPWRWWVQALPPQFGLYGRAMTVSSRRLFNRSEKADDVGSGDDPAGDILMEGDKMVSSLAE